MPAKQQPESVVAECYLTIEPTHSSWAYDDKDRKILEGARIVSMTKSQPERQVRAGTIVTKVKIRIPSRLLLPLLPVVEIVLSDSDIETVIQAQAEDPGYPVEDDAS